METPEFWRDLREQFLALHSPHRDLYAMPYGDSWRVSLGKRDDGGDAVRLQFIALGRRAGLAADVKPPDDPLEAWLGRLQRGPHYAAAFSRGLERPVSVEELTRSPD